MSDAPMPDFDASLAACDRHVKDRRPHKSRPIWDTYLPALIGYALFALKWWVLAKILIP